MMNKKPICQHTFCSIANFVQAGRSRFAIIFIFNRKYAVPKLATKQSVGTLCDSLVETKLTK